jgi:hypothetical protein
MHPFTARMIPTVGFAIAACLVCRWLPDTGKPYIDLVVKSFLFCVLFGVPVWKLGISPDINTWIAKFLKRIKLLGFTSEVK